MAQSNYADLFSEPAAALKKKPVTKAAPKPAAPVAAAAANQSDFLGEGTVKMPQPAKPASPTVRPLSDAERAAAGLPPAGSVADLRPGETPAQAAARTAQATATTNLPYGQQRTSENQALIEAQAGDRNKFWSQAGVEFPYVSDIPLVGNTINGALTGAQRGVLGTAEDIVKNPVENFLTAGGHSLVEGADALIDDVATGVTRDVTGNDHGRVNVPLTPGQLASPDAPLYVDGQGNNINLGNPLDALGDALGGVDFGGGFNGGGGGGSGGGNASGRLDQATQQADRSRAMGTAVLNGNVAPGGAGASSQAAVMDDLQGFLSGPRSTQGAASNNANFRENAPKATADTLADAERFAGGPRATDAAGAEVAGYRNGTRDQDAVLNDINGFLSGPETPSKAQLLLDKASQDAMSDVLSASRSGRARDAGSQARQSSVAQGEIAGMGVDNARNAALLRAQEADDFKSQQLEGIKTKGGLAESRDRGTLEALGLGSTLATADDANTLGALNLSGEMSRGLDSDALRSLELEGTLARGLDTDTLAGLDTARGIAGDNRTANVTERGQTLDFTHGLEATGAQLEGDVLKTLPQLEQVRHDDQYDLTPEQKLWAAGLGGVGNVLGAWLG